MIPAAGALTVDVFDTAIRRVVARPGDVHLVTGARLRAAGLTGLEPDGFRAAREAAEGICRTRAAAEGRDEPRLREIHDYLAACGVVTGDSVGHEIAAEIAVCRPVEGMREALAGREALFLSDTVMEGEQLGQVLAACGYDGARVLTSADVGRSKHGGRLFAEAAVRLGLAAGEILHVGDNPHSDVAQARAAGFRALHRPARAFPPENQAVVGAGSVARLLASMRRVRGKAGLERFATLLAVGWAERILAVARARGIGRIYFFARDGWLPMEIARRRLARTGEAIELRYLQVSRRSIVGVKGLEAENAVSYLRQEGFTEPGARIVVDVGWRGSTQRAIADLAGLASSDIVGCYLGLLPEALSEAISPGNTDCALFGFGAPADAMAMVMDGYALPELLFSAPHGTVLGYERGEDGVVRPVLGAAPPVEVGAIGAGVLAEFEALDAVLDGAWPEIPSSALLHELTPLLTTPNLNDVREINRIGFINGPDGQALTAINHMPLHEMLRFPGRALRRARNCPWRAGWVRLHLPPPLPAMDYATFADRARRLGVEAEG